MLNGTGFVPGDPGSRDVFGKHEVIARHGPALDIEGGGAARGYKFRDEDGEEYNLYVIELYERVHQRTLRHGLLPLHFARGLAVESAGDPVNWVAFAMARCFPPWKKSPFAPLEKFSQVKKPFPFFNKRVLPGPDPAGTVPRQPAQGPPVSALTYRYSIDV